MTKEESFKALAEKITKAILDKGLNRKEFAKLMCQAPSIATRWLKGKHNFTIDSLIKIEHALDVKLLNIEIKNNINVDVSVINAHLFLRDPLTQKVDSNYIIE